MTESIPQRAPLPLARAHMTDPDARSLPRPPLRGSGVHRRVSSFVALGDSFTAGKGCAPGESWADRVAASLRDHEPRLTYRNLAADGATSDAVLGQVSEALQLEPDLVTVICGANDVLRSVRPDVDHYARTLERILDRLRGALPGGAILTATSPESWRFMELGPRTRARVTDGLGRVNGATRAIAAGRGIPCLDVVDHPGLADRANFSADGLHPSPSGHERAAWELARVLHDEFGIDIGTEGRQP
jgi:phosphatidylinositol alpha 1,6-mannosyltransferase